MDFHWTLSDSKSPQVSRTLLSILAVLNNAVVWMVSTRPPTSKSSSPFSSPLVTVPNAPITIGIIVTCMFHSFFQFLSKVEVLILLFTFFQFYSVVSRDSKVDYFASSLFFCWLLLSLDRDIGPAVRVFANGPGDLGSIPGRVIPKTLKMELDTTLLNTQHYKVRFKGKVEQSREWSSALPYTLV